ncbi:hypothetical protein ACODM8_19265 [Vibrio ostreicida]|uniref:Uncharacterized protein n=1 Tax=Vibrio ostreicida TaxID=526588 RepID=A0ABT8BNY2_9VIBR|nr:hypothetical protein [Vibrio ostreicida]MDN3608613.1 hypothetical protein [Vibrio ostreicida]NPD10752.1 hypothetical protein [Vibrio ostreicida]
MTVLDRVTTYSVLCLLSLCALVFRSSEDVSLMPLLGVVATVLGIWLEMHSYSGASDT